MFKLTKNLPIQGVLDFQIKYNENIVGYNISHKNHLNRQIFCAKKYFTCIFCTASLGLKGGIGPTLRQKV